MSKIEISLESKPLSYPIFIGTGNLANVQNLIEFGKYSKFVIILDENLDKNWSAKIKDWFPADALKIVIEPGESNKNLHTLSLIWSQMLELKLDRRSLVINLGGGVVGDMGGLASSTYMRGVDFIQIPTTLLSQVDASVGGKLAIDFENYKNTIGVFTQPKAVIIDPNMLSTLPVRELISGLAEMIKHGLIYKLEHFKKLSDLKLDRITGLTISNENPDQTLEKLTVLINESIQIKAKVVELDPYEKGLRQILNFGHTVGHAVESLSHQSEYVQNSLLHGEAVGIGMIAESYLSVKQGFISEQEFHLIESTIAKLGLPTRLKTNDLEREQVVNELLSLISKDKKNVSGKTKWVLLESLGKAVYGQEISDSDTFQALDYIIV